MPHVAAGELSMYYEEHGHPVGPPLVLLHAFTATGTLWRQQLEALGARYRLLVPDWRGHGHTANPDGLAAMNHRQFARDVIAFCRALGVARAAFCGQSSGGMLLLTLALEAPDLAAALVLSGVTHRLNPSDEVRARNARLTPDNFLRESDDPGNWWRATAHRVLMPGVQWWRRSTRSAVTRQARTSRSPKRCAASRPRR